MANGTVLGIYIATTAGAPIQGIDTVWAFLGQGLEGDRYRHALGSFNREAPGTRQVTLINGLFFKDSGFEYHESRRNIVTLGVELMDLIGKEFEIGGARMRGVKYCDPCLRPSALVKKKIAFRDVFHDRGGLVAEILKSGRIDNGSAIVPPKKNY